MVYALRLLLRLAAEIHLQPSVDAISRDVLRSLVDQVLQKQGKSFPVGETDRLLDLGLSSLDLAELTVRLEDLAGGELFVEAAEIRPLDTVGDLIDLLASLVGLA